MKNEPARLPDDEAPFRWTGRRKPANTLPPEQVRLQIIDAAESCFERYGIARITMDDIARAANVSRPAIYRHFGDRDGLIMAVVYRRSRALIERGHAVIESYPTLAEQLVEGTLFLVEHTRADPFIRMLISTEHMGLTSPVPGMGEAALELAAEVWLPFLEAAQERGELAPERELRELARWILMISIMFVSRYDLFPADPDGPRRLLTEFLLPAFRPDWVPPHAVRHSKRR